MKRADFKIGMEFWTGSGKWRCTDVGTRTITAIQIDHVDVVEHDGPDNPPKHRRVSDDPSWFSGPPYAVAEHCFDEDGVEGCSLESVSIDPPPLVAPDLTLRQLQESLPWDLSTYSEAFLASPVQHRDFGHAMTHITKAAGKLACVVDDAEHGGSEFKPEEVDKYIADLVVCALRLANTVPGRVVDLQRAVQERIAGKKQEHAAKAVDPSWTISHPWKWYIDHADRLIVCTAPHEHRAISPCYFHEATEEQKRARPTSGGPERCPTGPCSECTGPHHFGDMYVGFIDDEPDHPAALLGYECWMGCRHCDAWKLDDDDEG